MCGQFNFQNILANNYIVEVFTKVTTNIVYSYYMMSKSNILDYIEHIVEWMNLKNIQLRKNMKV